MATRVIDDSKLQDIAVAIQGKDGGGTMTVDQMPTRIAAISTIPEKPDPNGALLLMDWEGTILQSYTHAEAMALEALPNVADTPYYPLVDHELLTFQRWAHSLSYAQDYLRNRLYGQFIIGALYTTSDNEEHSYWQNPRLTTSKMIYIRKTKTVSYGVNAFRECICLKYINFPEGFTSFPTGLLYNCSALVNVNIPDSVTTFGTSPFNGCAMLTHLNIPHGTSVLSQGFASYCRRLYKVIIPSTVETIGISAFSECNSLTEIEIPFSVTSIGSSVFANCSNLQDVVIHGKPALSSTNAFTGTPSDQKIYVHRSDLSWFETETNWSTIYAQGKIVAAADYLDHLISIGIDVTDFENEVISE